MSERRPVLLLVNPVSGGKLGSPASDTDPQDLEPEALETALRRRGLEVRLHLLAEDDAPDELAAGAAAEGCDVVVAGGDGTVGPVAAALCGEDATLGIVPTGSWNNVATAVGVPAALEEALDAIGAGAWRHIDAGLAWHPEESEEPPPDAVRFFEAAGVGLDAAGFGASQIGERHGPVRAIRAAWRALRRRRTRMRLVVDGRRLGTTAPAVTVCNGPYMGMGFAIAPDADPGDGMLNVVVFSGMSRWELLRHFLAVARRRPHREPRTTRLTARRITISGVRRVLPAHADGRSIGTTPVTFAVDPSALRVFAPAPSPAKRP